MKKKISKTFLNNAFTYLLVIVAFVVIFSMQNAGKLSFSFKNQLVPACVFIVMAVSLNLVVGISGELSLGHAGFMCVGAFSGCITIAVLNGVVLNPTLRLIIGLVVGAAFAALTGFIVGVPVLRLRGDYLAIVTLAFGEIIRNILNCLYVSLDEAGLHFGFNNPTLPGKMIVNGPMGVKNDGRLATFVMGFALVMFTLIVVLNLINSRSGRAMMALRDNRIAAESVGISATKYKLMAFVISAALAGMAGVLYGSNIGTVTSKEFIFDKSILVLVYVVFGGIGNIWGSIISAALLTTLPELLRSFPAFKENRMLIFAIVLILVMLITNSSMVKGWISRIFSKKKEEAVPGEAAQPAASEAEEEAAPEETQTAEEGGTEQ